MAVVLTSESITQGTIKPIKDRSLQQEGLNVLGLLTQNFLNQIIQHKAVFTGERFDEICSVIMSLYRDSG